MKGRVARGPGWCCAASKKKPHQPGPRPTDGHALPQGAGAKLVVLFRNVPSSPSAVHPYSALTLDPPLPFRVCRIPPQPVIMPYLRFPMPTTPPAPPPPPLPALTSRSRYTYSFAANSPPHPLPRRPRRCVLHARSRPPQLLHAPARVSTFCSGARLLNVVRRGCAGVRGAALT